MLRKLQDFFQLQSFSCCELGWSSLLPCVEPLHKPIGLISSFATLKGNHLFVSASFVPCLSNLSASAFGAELHLRRCKRPRSQQRLPAPPRRSSGSIILHLASLPLLILQRALSLFAGSSPEPGGGAPQLINAGGAEQISSKQTERTLHSSHLLRVQLLLAPAG